VAQTHYETLGLKRLATAAEVKSAYRKIALSHHPDRSKDPRSHSVFLSATAAYEVLSDPVAKLRYDEALQSAIKAEADRAKKATSDEPPKSRPKGPPPGWGAGPRIDSATVAEDVRKLKQLYGTGRHAEAEKLAKEIARVSPKHPEVYAVMGDIARQRGDINEAARMYAYAAQFEPSNPVYQRRYEQLLNSTQVTEDRRMRTQLQGEDGKVLGPMAGGVIVLAGAIYLAISPEKAMFTKIPMVSTWTLGIVFTLFLSGIAVGASLAMGNLLDRFNSTMVTATGKLSPNVALGLVALVNFWAATILYLLLGGIQRAFNFSTTRLLIGVVVQVFVLTLAVAVTQRMDGLQVLFWGGNLAYIGALVGWLVADAFRP